MNEITHTLRARPELPESATGQDGWLVGWDGPAGGPVVLFMDGARQIQPPPPGWLDDVQEFLYAQGFIVRPVTLDGRWPAAAVVDRRYQVVASPEEE